MTHIKPMGVGEVIFLSPGGMIVGHSDAALSGRKFEDTAQGRLLAQDVQEVARSGQPLVRVVEKGWTDGVEDAAAAIYGSSG